MNVKKKIKSNIFPVIFQKLKFKSKFNLKVVTWIN